MEKSGFVYQFFLFLMFVMYFPSLLWFKRVAEKNREVLKMEDYSILVFFSLSYFLVIGVYLWTKHWSPILVITLLFFTLMELKDDVKEENF